MFIVIMLFSKLISAKKVIKNVVELSGKYSVDALFKTIIRNYISKKETLAQVFPGHIEKHLFCKANVNCFFCHDEGFK